jgi:hypothetical protein
VSVLGFVANLKNTSPAAWYLLLEAKKEGLVTIDEELDAITATNHLLLIYPGLHEVLTRIINAWTEDQAIKDFNVKDVL